MGVIAFAMITSLGIIPVGLSTLRQAMDNTVESQIVQGLGAKILLTPYSQLATNFSGAVFYYDEQGSFLTNAPATRPLSTRYCATATVTSPSFPGSTNTVVTNSLSTIQVELIGGPSAPSTNFYSFQAPNSGN